MPERLRSHLSTNLVAYLALFVALGGSSYAAVKVGSGQIKNNSVRSVDIRNNSVRGADIRNGTIVRRDLRTSTLDSLKGPTGARGATGAAGAPGTALAFAKVTSTGGVDAARSKNVTNANVSNPEAGYYCFDLPVPTRAAVATLVGAWNRTIAVADSTEDLQGFYGCPAGADWAVSIQRNDTNAFEDASFYVFFN